MKQEDKLVIALPMRAISTNKIWTGKRFLSAAARDFKKEAHHRLLLERSELKQMLADAGDGELAIRFSFGLSRDADVDNCLKLVLDVLSAMLGIDDRRFRGVSAMKTKVKRGSEFIRFAISAFDEKDFEV